MCVWSKDRNRTNVIYGVSVIFYLWPKDRNRINIIYDVSVIFYLWPKDRNVCVCVPKIEIG